MMQKGRDALRRVRNGRDAHCSSDFASRSDLRSADTRRVRRGSVALLALCLAANVWGVQVQNVRGEQREGSNKVDIWYDLPSSKGCTYEVELKFEGKKTTPPADTLSGDYGTGVEPGKNRHIVWDAGKDFPKSEDDLKAVISATEEAVDPSMGMVRIPGGTNAGTDPDFGPYSLTVDTFYMDRTEVTYAQWERVYNWAIRHGYEFNWKPAETNSPERIFSGSKYPIRVEWVDVIIWCNARSEMEHLIPIYLNRYTREIYRDRKGIVWNYNPMFQKGNGYRLPSFEQWQYAARGGLIGCRFPWGNEISHKNALYYGSSKSYSFDLSDGRNQAYEIKSWYYDSFFQRERVVSYWLAPVASFPPNGYGLYDIVGNVLEYNDREGGHDWGYVHGGCEWLTADYCRIGSSPRDAYDLQTGGGFRCVKYDNR